MGSKGERVVSEREAAIRAALESGVPRECVESDACRWGGLLASIDGYSASESMLPWMTWRDWGWKAAVASASDVAASGGRPRALLVSLGVPRPEVGVEIARGVGEAASWMGALVLGGDFNSCNCDAWMDVAVVGEELYWSPRWAAKPGDLLVRAGPLGYGAVALALLRDPRLASVIPKRVLDYIRRPKPPLRLPEELAARGCIPHAAIDNSDGWSETLWLLAEASGATLALESINGSEELAGLLSELYGGVESAVLLSAEDYTMLLAVNADQAGCVLDSCKSAGVECEIIGRVEGEGVGVIYRGRRVPRVGWDSFRRA